MDKQGAFFLQNRQKIVRPLKQQWEGTSLGRHDVDCVLSCRASNNNISAAVETSLKMDLLCEFRGFLTGEDRLLTSSIALWWKEDTKSLVNADIIAFF